MDLRPLLFHTPNEKENPTMTKTRKHKRGRPRKSETGPRPCHRLEVEAVFHLRRAIAAIEEYEELSEGPGEQDPDVMEPLRPFMIQLEMAADILADVHCASGGKADEDLALLEKKWQALNQGNLSDFADSTLAK
jgi:hypothetical protein